MRNGRVLVAVANKFNHPAAVSFSLMTWGDCQIHQFILPVSFFSKLRQWQSARFGDRTWQTCRCIPNSGRSSILARRPTGAGGGNVFCRRRFSGFPSRAIQKQILVPAVGSAICVDSVMTTDVTPAAMHSKALSSLGIMPSAMVPSAFSCL